MQKSIKDMKYNYNFKLIFEKPGKTEYARDELLKMKKNRTGTNLKNIEKITVTNIPEGKCIIDGKIK